MILKITTFENDWLTEKKQAVNGIRIYIESQDQSIELVNEYVKGNTFQIGIDSFLGEKLLLRIRNLFNKPFETIIESQKVLDLEIELQQDLIYI